MKHRVFVAINLPENVKNELASLGNRWPELPARWTKKENLHVTLEFLGYVDDTELIKICRETKDMALKKKPFVVVLKKICYGPLKKMPPRMVWAVGERIEELNLVPHITLARIRVWDFRRIEPDERPSIEEDIDLSFDVESIEVMESVLKKGGPTYTVLESCPLKKN